jgi:25S rRNA (adenine2142-N1)-methyltransferase
MTRSGDLKGKAAGPGFGNSRKSAGGAGRAQKVNTGKYENTDRTDGYKRSASNHARKIALYHTLEKQIARTTGKERERLVAEQEKLGGLHVYQEASLRGARHGESSKWLMQQLESRRGRRKTRLLDVGAIAGTSYSKYSSVT